MQGSIAKRERQLAQGAFGRFLGFRLLRDPADALVRNLQLPQEVRERNRRVDSAHALPEATAGSGRAHPPGHAASGSQETDRMPLVQAAAHAWRSSPASANRARLPTL